MIASVITPVYKTPLSLFEEAFRSLLAQSCGFDRIEWLVGTHHMDEAETSLLRQITGKRDNVVFLAEDRGDSPSYPRNLCLRHARGKYLFFLDSDDTMAPDCIERAVSAMEASGADMGVFGYSVNREKDRTREVTCANAPREGLVVYRQGDPRILSLMACGGSMLWCRTYRREFLQKTGITLDETLRVGEDIRFNMDLTAQAGLVCALPGLIGCTHRIWDRSLIESERSGNSMGDRLLPLLPDIQAQGFTELAWDHLSFFAANAIERGGDIPQLRERLMPVLQRMRVMAPRFSCTRERIEGMLGLTCEVLSVPADPRLRQRQERIGRALTRERLEAQAALAAAENVELRTIGTTGDRNPFLGIEDPDARPAVEWLDISRMPPESRKSHMESYRRVELARGFAENGEVRCRVTAFRLSEEETVISVTWDDRFVGEQGVDRLLSYLSASPESIPDVLAGFADSDEIALICGEERLTYRQLLLDARRAAKGLIARGVLKGDRVVLNMSRSADYLRMYLGVILAGGVQVTLHKGWSAMVREEAIKDCAPALILDDEGARAILSGDLKSKDLPLPKLSGSDPFQIIYTSGSTGKPKGVVTCQELALSCLYAKGPGAARSSMRRDVMGCAHRVFLDVDLSFVVSTFQIFLGLLNGKTLVMAEDEAMRSPRALASCLRAHGVDFLFTVPSRLGRCLADPDYRSAASQLRLVLLTGEIADKSLLAGFRQCCMAEYRYAYCSSEVFYAFDAHVPMGGGVRYGAFEMMEAGAFLFVPGGNDEVSPGETGEICIGGAAGRLGRYWNNPALTAEKYGTTLRYGRIFRTGDLAVREADGSIRILGRMDHMVKLHGMRVEIQAIEGAMEAFPGIGRAAVRIQGEGAEAALCGYYTGSVDQGALRRHLSKELPYYMVPALLMELPELPLNLNGKLDRGALPEIRDEKGSYVPPSTKEEALLCEAFARVLSTDAPVGVDDDFFRLGGDSMKGMAVAAMLGEEGYELRTEWLFAAPTVRQLARMLSLKMESQESQESQGALDGEPWSRKPTDEEWAIIEKSVPRDLVEAVYPVLPEVERFVKRNEPWWLDEILPVGGELTLEELRRRMEASSRAHPVLRSVFVGVGCGNHFQVVLKHAAPSVFQADLRHLSEKGGDLSAAQVRYLRSLTRLQKEQPMPGDEVMFRAGLVRVSEERSLLVLLYSHLLLDGAGKKRIWEELALGRTPVSDAVQYGRRMREMAGEERMGSEGADALMSMLPDDPSGEKGLVFGTFVADPELVQSIERFCRERRATLSAVVALSLGRTLCRLTGGKRAGFFVMGSGRGEGDLGLTGMFARRYMVFTDEAETLAGMQSKLLGLKGGAGADPSGLSGAQGCHVVLGVQNYAETEGIKSLDLDAYPGGYGHRRERSPFPVGELMLTVIPGRPLVFVAMRDGRTASAETVEELVASLMRSLRVLINEEEE